jgi:hypothetical protein
LCKFRWKFLSLLISKSLFLTVLGFELKPLAMLDTCSTSWAMPPAQFCFSYFSDRLKFLPKVAFNDIPTSTFHVALCTTMYHNAQPSEPFKVRLFYSIKCFRHYPLETNDYFMYMNTALHNIYINWKTILCTEYY